MARPRAIPYQQQMTDLLDQPAPIILTPHWRRAPCASMTVRAVDLDPDALAERIDAYFAECYDQGIQPTYCDMAAVTGFASLVQMMNHARRQPAVMEKLSRGLLAVAAGYEDATAKGLRTGSFLLERLQGFDPAEAPTQRRENFFTREQEVNVRLSGVVQQENIGGEMTPLEAYQRVIKFKTHQEALSQQGEVVEADYVEIPNE
jgi:hypothetical protein